MPLLFFRDDGSTPRNRIHDQKGITRATLLVSQLHLPGNATVLGADERAISVAPRTWIVRRTRHFVDHVDVRPSLGQVRAESHRDWLVLWRDDVLLVQDPVEFRLIHEQTRRSSLLRLQAAEFVGDFVNPRLRQWFGRSRVAENIARPHLESHLVQQTERAEPLAMFFVDLLLLDRRLGRFIQLRFLHRISLGQHHLGGGKVLFDVGWRQRHHRADALKPMPLLIL